MPMVEADAIAAALAELDSHPDFDINNPLFRGNVMIQAIVNAVIAEVRKGDINGTVVGGGSSSGAATQSNIT